MSTIEKFVRISARISLAPLREERVRTEESRGKFSPGM
jgi:hypothetical protein